MADYIDKNILCQAYIHVELPDNIGEAELETIKQHLIDFATSRGKFFVYPDVEVSVEFKNGSLKAYISIAGLIYIAIGQYGSFRSGVDFLHTDIKRLADSLVSESLFMTKSKYQNIVRTEARTGVIGSLKTMVDAMNDLDDSLGNIPVDEVARRIKNIKEDADVLLTNVRSEQDVINIEDELSEFAGKLPDRCPHPEDRRPEDSAVILYQDALLDFRKTYDKRKKLKIPTRKTNPEV